MVVSYMVRCFLCHSARTTSTFPNTKPNFFVGKWIDCHAQSAFDCQRRTPATHLLTHLIHIPLLFSVIPFILPLTHPQLLFSFAMLFLTHSEPSTVRSVIQPYCIYCCLIRPFHPLSFLTFPVKPQPISLPRQYSQPILHHLDQFDNAGPVEQ